MRSIAHYGIHFGLPLLIVLIFFNKNWKQAYLIMIAGMLIDLDHLLATPIFDTNRCSIDFHPLHSYFAIVIYLFLLLPKKTRLIGLGLCIHILADFVDCWLM